MLVLVSPTKTQKIYKGESNDDSLFVEKTKKILSILSAYSEEEIQKRMKISPKLAQQVYTNYQHYCEDNVAIHTYQGASFKAMTVDQWTPKDTHYAETHLHIFSAVYGLVRPFDLIGLYRLDFLNDFSINLYDFWRKDITHYLNMHGQTILNLASQEYTKMIDRDALRVPLIKIDFKEQTDKGFVSKSTYAKVARGTATKLIIQRQIDTLEAIKKLSFDGYHYNDALSSEFEYIFTR